MSQADDQEPFLLPEEEAEVLALLQAAVRPSELDPKVHELLLAVALEDPLAPPSEAELVESARLRDALADGRPHPDAGLLSALGAPFGTAIDGDAVDRALAAASATPPAAEAPRRSVVYVLFGGASAALAAAAAVALLFAAPKPEPSAATPTAPQWVRPRSTEELFDERFETSGTTARMDRIASARGRDLRDNRYAAWGLR
ncbi:MAG: hypothetical protein EOO73_29755 [Myxococcales bacterium]|nr:MAG: hypothetical protein EOO73_29755 [Myxococcales bacterium]